MITYIEPKLKIKSKTKKSHFDAAPCRTLTQPIHIILLSDGDNLQGMELKWQLCKVLWVISVRDRMSWVKR